MSYFETKTKHPREHVEQVFGPKSNATLASKIKREDPQLYRELKLDAQALHLIDLDVHQANILKNGPKPQHTYTEEEARALAEFSEADVNRFYRGNSGLKQDSLMELKKTDPAKAGRLRLAAVLRGVPLPEREKRPEPSKAPAPEATQALPDALCDHFGFPRGHQATQKNWLILTEAYATMKAEQDSTAK